MTAYRVEWAIDVEAEDAQAAAMKGWEIQQANGSTALVFEVSDEHDRTTRVDLYLGEQGGTVWVPAPEAVADLAEWMDQMGWPVSEICAMIRRPNKYAAEFTTMIVDREFDKVAREPEREDDTVEHPV